MGDARDRPHVVRVGVSRTDARLDATVDAIMEATVTAVRNIVRDRLREHLAHLAPPPRRGPMLTVTDEDRARAEAADEVTRARARAILDRATRRPR